MIKHPKQLGFKLGLKIRLGKQASITKRTPDASTVRDVVYVALLDESSRPLKKGDALKIGQSGGSLLRRWQGIVGIFNRNENALKPNEVQDRRRLLKFAPRKEVYVWMRAAGKIRIPYAKGVAQSSFSRRWAEEEFLDQYYEPKIGKRMNSRRPGKKIKLFDPN